MIPDFKTYIKESAWGDMMRRSSGEMIRKEDDIELFDVYQLADYLKDNYNCSSESTILTLVNGGENICVNLFEDTNGYDTYLFYYNLNGERELCVTTGLKTEAEYIYKDMEHEYKLFPYDYEDASGHPIEGIKIEPKGARYTNITHKFFLEVLDYIIERIHKPLKKEISKK